ncbi:MAG: hypothetical protein HY716_12485 [Planctomycetes bacterium]|nr:hypothetical protein [Planctomycetota bacterium]
MADSDSAKAEPPGGSQNSAVVVEIRKHIKDLTSEDYAVRSESASGLEKFGQRGAEVLAETLLTKPMPHQFLRSFEEALEEIGKPCLPAVLRGLSQIREIRKREDVYLIELFVEVLSNVGDRRVATIVAAQLGKLNRRIKHNHDRLLTDVCVAAKVRLHGVLAGLDSAAGLDDLLGMLGDGRRRVPDGLVAAVEKVGDRRALVPLIRLYRIEEVVTFSGAQLIKTTIREIMRRERITAKDRVFKDLNPEERAVLEKLLWRNRNGHA